MTVVRKVVATKMPVYQGGTYAYRDIVIAPHLHRVGVERKEDRVVHL
jgi:hypothetical protein